MVVIAVTMVIKPKHNRINNRMIDIFDMLFPSVCTRIMAVPVSVHVKKINTIRFHVREVLENERVHHTPRGRKFSYRRLTMEFFFFRAQR